MISINGQSGTYVLDLNESTSNYNTVTVDSTSSWNLYMNTRPDLYVKQKGPNTLVFDIDLTKLKEEFQVYLKNLSKEYLKIVVLPNKELSRDRDYVFKLGKYTFEGDKATINVISKENGVNEPWTITQDGYPLAYEIKRTKTKAEFELNAKLAIPYDGTVIFTQDNSGKTIKIRISHDVDGTIQEIKAD